MDFTNCYCRYKMTEASGNLVDQYDAYPGVVSGGVIYGLTGKLDKALDISGTNSSIQMGAVTQFGYYATTFTIEFLSKIKVIDNVYNKISVLRKLEQSLFLKPLQVNYSLDSKIDIVDKEWTLIKKLFRKNKDKPENDWI